MLMRRCTARSAQAATGSTQRKKHYALWLPGRMLAPSLAFISKPGDSHVKRTPHKTHLSILWIDTGRHARETDHGGHGVAMRGLRRDLQGQTSSRQVSRRFFGVRPVR